MCGSGYQLALPSSSSFSVDRTIPPFLIDPGVYHFVPRILQETPRPLLLSRSSSSIPPLGSCLNHEMHLLKSCVGPHGLQKNIYIFKTLNCPTLTYFSPPFILFPRKSSCPPLHYLKLCLQSIPWPTLKTCVSLGLQQKSAQNKYMYVKFEFILSHRVITFSF